VLIAGVGLVAAAGAAFELLPGGTAPRHLISTPQRLGSYTQAPALAAGMQAAQLRNSIVKQGKGEASHVVDAVYQDGSSSAAQSGSQVFLFIGGNLSGTSAKSFISSFIGGLPHAVTAAPGSLGGAAACAPGVSGRPAECAWADGDTFGLVASPTLGASALASELRQIRPGVERRAK
jgi:hypothetical protein